MCVFGEQFITQLKMNNIIISVVIFIIFQLFILSFARQGKRTQFWICLERCGDTKEQIQNELDTIKRYSKSSLTAISYEIYNIGPNATIYENDDLSEVHSIVSQFDSFNGGKLETFPMISSYPYPKEIIEWMRYTFQNPDAFIDSCLGYLSKLNPKASGLNVDFEPVDGVTVDDGVNYAKFLNYFSKKMHEHGYEIQVDVSSWSVLWNYTLLSQQENLGEVVTMSTYAGPKETWLKAFDKAYTEIGTQKLNVGLMTTNPNTKDFLSDEEIQWRFEQIKSKGIQSVAVWKMSTELQDITQWWKSFNDFLEN